jgi:Protein of unknown function (DUF2924)
MLMRLGPEGGVSRRLDDPPSPDPAAGVGNPEYAEQVREAAPDSGQQRGKERKSADRNWGRSWGRGAIFGGSVYYFNYLAKYAGGEGGIFEPPARLHILRISSAARSITLPPLLKACLVARNCHPGELGAAMHRLGFVRQRDCRSLTQIAGEITGAHWSGPRFFGLKVRKRRTGPGEGLKRAPSAQR